MKSRIAEAVLGLFGVTGVALGLYLNVFFALGGPCNNECARPFEWYLGYGGTQLLLLLSVVDLVAIGVLRYRRGRSARARRY